jgi:hypothetical protein
MSSRFLFFCRFISLGLALSAQAQHPAAASAPAAPSPAESSPAASKPVTSGVDNDFIHEQFGSTCNLMPGPPQVKVDMDGDGIEDLIVAAHCSNALVDQAEKEFTVIDPYNSFYGYGNTKITTQFATEDPATRGLVLLIIHGAGAEAWRAATPKAKFVIINLPFKQISVKKLTVKKKTIMAIYAEETGGDRMTSATFWDGKKYRYQPLGSSMEQ